MKHKFYKREDLIIKEINVVEPNIVCREIVKHMYSTKESKLLPLWEAIMWKLVKKRTTANVCGSTGLLRGKVSYRIFELWNELRIPTR
jgi:hypothetical protein